MKRELYISEETYKRDRQKRHANTKRPTNKKSHEKRSIYMKRELYISEETYKRDRQKRHANTKRPTNKKSPTRETRPTTET